MNTTEDSGAESNPAVRSASETARSSSSDLRDRPLAAGTPGASATTGAPNPTASSRAVGPKARRPSQRAFQNASTPLPKADTSPTPEIAQRLMPPGADPAR